MSWEWRVVFWLRVGIVVGCWAIIILTDSDVIRLLATALGVVVGMTMWKDRDA